MTAKDRLIAAARAGGADAVRAIRESGGLKDVVTVRATMSVDLLQYRLTDNNYHSVEIVAAGNGVITLSAPIDYGLATILTEVFGFEVVA